MSWAGQAAKHDADHRKAHEGYDGPSIALEIACQATVAADPGEGSLDDPALGQHDELVQFGALDDFDHPMARAGSGDRKSTRLNSSHQIISYAVFCLKKKTPVNHHPASFSPLPPAPHRPPCTPTPP